MRGGMRPFPSLSRKLGIDPELALRKATDKFQARFEGMESTARDRDEHLQDLSLDELDQRWNAAKETTKMR